MRTNDPDLLRVVYFSHHTSGMTPEWMAWDIDTILEKSQINNERADVTGALIFNRGVFGQVLEGPIAAVEDTFERIQLDERHDQITVLDLSRVSERAFANWSMGFVGTDCVAAELFGNIGRATDFDIASLSGQQIFEALHALALKKEIVGRAA